MKTYIHRTGMLRHRLTLILIFISLARLSGASGYMALGTDMAVATLSDNHFCPDITVVLPPTDIPLFASYHQLYARTAQRTLFCRRRHTVCHVAMGKAHNYQTTLHRIAMWHLLPNGTRCYTQFFSALGKLII
ncbi:MAG: hypothetical protein ACI30H_06120 [Paludibacteraceae bacterium]